MKSPGFQQDPLSAELEDLKEKADLILCQLQTAQAQLEAEIYSHEAAREENSLLLKELHQAQEELEKYYFYAQEQRLVLDRTTSKLSWKRDQLNKLTQLIKGHVGLQKRTLSLATRIALSSRREDGVKLNPKSNVSPPL